MRLLLSSIAALLSSLACSDVLFGQSPEARWVATATTVPNCTISTSAPPQLLFSDTVPVFNDISSQSVRTMAEVGGTIFAFPRVVYTRATTQFWTWTASATTAAEFQSSVAQHNFYAENSVLNGAFVDSVHVLGQDIYLGFLTIPAWENWESASKEQRSAAIYRLRTNNYMVSHVAGAEGRNYQGLRCDQTSWGKSTSLTFFYITGLTSSADGQTLYAMAHCKPSADTMIYEIDLASKNHPVTRIATTGEGTTSFRNKPGTATGLSRVGNKLYWLEMTMEFRYLDLTTNTISTITSTKTTSGFSMPLNQLKIESPKSGAQAYVHDFHELLDEYVNVKLTPAGTTGYLLLHDVRHLYLIDPVNEYATKVYTNEANSYKMTGSHLSLAGGSIWFAVQEEKKKNWINKISYSLDSAVCPDRSSLDTTVSSTFAPFRRYRLFKSTTDVAQDQADRACGLKGGYLASMTTEQEVFTAQADVMEQLGAQRGNTDLSGLIPDTSKVILIGGSDADTESTFQWKYGPDSVRGSNISYVRDDTGKIKCEQDYCTYLNNPYTDGTAATGGADALGIRASDWKWEAIPDGISHSTGLEKQLRHTSTFLCEFVQYEALRLVHNPRYVAHLQRAGKQTQATASTWCQDKGGYLATFRNSSDYTQLQNDLTQQGEMWNNMVTGGADVDSSTHRYEWKYGPSYNLNLPISTGLAPGVTCDASAFCIWRTDTNTGAKTEPNNAHSGQGLIAVRSDFTWNDIGGVNRYLCEHPEGVASLIDTTAYVSAIPIASSPSNAAAQDDQSNASPAVSKSSGNSESSANNNNLLVAVIAVVSICVFVAVLVIAVVKKVTSTPHADRNTDGYPVSSSQETKVDISIEEADDPIQPVSRDAAATAEVPQDDIIHV